MRLKFKKPTYSKKVKSVDGIMHDVTYSTVTCILERSNSELRMQDILPRKFWKECRELENLFIKYEYEDSNKHGLVYKIISVGKAVKSTTDNDNPELAKKLAEARAKLQCYEYAEAVCNAMFHCLKELIYGNLLVTTNTPECTSNGGMYDQWLYYQNLVEKEKYYISKLLPEL